MITLLRMDNVRIRVYLDDWLILAQSSHLCRLRTSKVLQLCSHLGFQINFQKCDLTPSQSFQFLGMVFHTVPMLVFPSQERVDRLFLLLNFLRQASFASARQLSALLGLMESLAPVIPSGKLWKRPLQRGLRRRWTQLSDSWEVRIPLRTWFHRATADWSDPQSLLKGVPIVPPSFEVALYTDASTTGWGAHMDSLHTSGSWTPQESSLHINILELEAVSRALRHFVSSLSNKVVRIFTDNTTVAFYLNKQGGAHSPALSLRAEDTIRWCLDHNILLSAVHIAGKSNILADALSRSHTVLPTEWTLQKKLLPPIWDLWFQPMVDLFATKFSKRLPIYVSPVPDPEAYATDALSISWTNILGYAFPPFPIIPQVLRKARLDEARLILIAPFWPAQPWFPDLQTMSHVPPVAIPVSENMLIQPRSGIPHANPQLLNLHAWLICGPMCPHHQ